MINLNERFNLDQLELVADGIVRATTTRGLTVCLKTYTNLVNFERSISTTQLLNRAAAPVPALMDWERTDRQGVILQAWWDGPCGEAFFERLSQTQQHQALHQIGTMHGLIQRIIPAETLLQASFWHRFGINTAQQYSWRGYLSAIVNANIQRVQTSSDSTSLAKSIAAIQHFLTTLAEPTALTIIHGDFVLRNVMFRPDGASIAGIIDWDLALLGDPVYDLAKIIWTDLDPSDTVSRQALFQGWQAATGWSIDPSILAYYEAIQAIAALAWISKQPQRTAGIEHFRQRALAALAHHDAKHS